MSSQTAESRFPASHVLPDLALPGFIVEPEWLTRRLGHADLRLLDVRSQEEFDRGHIPGAVHVELSSLSCTLDRINGMLLPPDRFAAKIGSLGIGNASTVVLYDGNWGMPAARVAWALLRYGHEAAAVMTGGWDRWREEAHPISVEAPTPPQETYVPAPNNTTIAELDWLRQQLSRADIVLVDTRTPVEYGQGHLPNAILWDWMIAVPTGSWDMFRPPEDLQRELAAIGITPDKEIITYCRSGARAAHTYLLLRHLGYPRVRNYDGSWLEWSVRQ